MECGFQRDGVTDRCRADVDPLKISPVADQLRLWVLAAACGCGYDEADKHFLLSLLFPRHRCLRHPWVVSRGKIIPMGDSQATETICAAINTLHYYGQKGCKGAICVGSPLLDFTSVR
jgi:hypothetical protein